MKENTQTFDFDKARSGGFDRLPHYLFEYPTFRDNPDIFMFFLKLLNKANRFEPKEIVVKGGKKITLNRGQLIFSTRNLADEIGKSIGWISKVINRLECEHLCERNREHLREHQFTILTICNYDIYNGTTNECVNTIVNTNVNTIVNRTENIKENKENIDNNNSNSRNFSKKEVIQLLFPKNPQALYSLENYMTYPSIDKATENKFKELDEDDRVFINAVASKMKWENGYTGNILSFTTERVAVIYKIYKNYPVDVITTHIWNALYDAYDISMNKTKNDEHQYIEKVPEWVFSRISTTMCGNNS